MPEPCGGYICERANSVVPHASTLFSRLLLARGIPHDMRTKDVRTAGFASGSVNLENCLEPVRSYLRSKGYSSYFGGCFSRNEVETQNYQ